MDLTPAEIRVLGCLLEKQRTTPDAYPLSLNALRLACNQSTNRDPVVDYDDDTIRQALHGLHHRRWARLAGAGRAPKYRHLLDEALPMTPDARAVLTVLMLRGPQTPGELKQRADRMHPFAGLDAVHAALERLIEDGLAAQQPRRPGQKEERYAHLLGDDAPEPAVAQAAAVAPAPPPSPAPTPTPAPAPAPPPADDDRVERLEREVAALREQVETLQARLDEVL